MYFLICVFLHKISSGSDIEFLINWLYKRFVPKVEKKTMPNTLNTT